MEELLGVGDHQKNNNAAKNTHGEKENKRHKWRDVSSNGGEKTIKPESALILPDQAAREAQGYKHISIRVYKHGFSGQLTIFKRCPHRPTEGRE